MTSVSTIQPTAPRRRTSAVVFVALVMLCVGLAQNLGSAADAPGGVVHARPVGQGPQTPSCPTYAAAATCQSNRHAFIVPSWFISEVPCARSRTYLWVYTCGNVSGGTVSATNAAGQIFGGQLYRTSPTSPIWAWDSGCLTVHDGAPIGPPNHFWVDVVGGQIGNTFVQFCCTCETECP